MFRIVLTEGIVGGFKPATVRRRVEIEGDENGGVIINITPKSKGEDDIVLRGVLTSQQVGAFVNDTKTILTGLPTENPMGGQDIYGFDTSIEFYSDGFEWRNGGPEGCGGEESEFSPTPQQKALFQELVQKIISISEQYAIQSVQ
ncbi:5288_t:CDS:2 [Diversispora eburnea]|uniref:5288_t:CDS:1 n=1 Tax=Diversispora eburnea TaxID=1213867 RepID=A0A9N8V469_9GLOM|nr:5288_t:CDS:2 [Diversispora eburnea]